MRASSVERTVPVERPYRLDLTAAVLRRFSTNIVDVVGPDGHYRRALSTRHGIVGVEVAQTDSASLHVRATGPAAAHAEALEVTTRSLGAGVRVQPFLRAARAVAWLAPIAQRMRGVHPPRYPTVWEACANAVVFQQISLIAASAMMRRLIQALGAPATVGGVSLHVFPTPSAVSAAPEATLRAAGLSAAKIRSLYTIAGALDSGTFDERALERSTSSEAAVMLQGLRGIGPWTAAVVLLRGLGRLDVFPENDSGAARSLALLNGGKPVATAPVLDILGTQRGMLYYHLLLARLEARGEIGSSL